MNQSWPIRRNALRVFRLSSSRGGRLRCAILSLLLLRVFSAEAARKDLLVFATSAADPVLTQRIASLGPEVSPSEAQQVAECAYRTGRDLRREWKVVWPPGLQNFLVNSGAKKGGLCFQWATELLIRLDRLKLKTLDLHWAESFPRTASEHNVIVVTARGQPMSQGILLDNWRYSGRLLWGPIHGDPHYDWKENAPEIGRRLPRRPVSSRAEATSGQ